MKELDAIIDHVYAEEIKTGVHFLSLLITSSNKKLNYEKNIFSKFLYDSKNILLSYGIILPSSIFKSLSFHSIDIPLTAVWLSTLSNNELDIFYNIKNKYILKLLEKENIQDQNDNNLISDMNTLLDEKKEKENEYFDSMKIDMILRKNQRLDNFIINLNETEKNQVFLFKDIWLNNDYCNVEVGDTGLYERFRGAVMNDIDSSVTYGRQVMAEIEVCIHICIYKIYIDICI